MIVTGMVRRSVLIGSAIAVLLLGAAAALIVPHSSVSPGEESKRQLAAVPQGGPPAVATDSALPKPASRPSVTPPSFDIVKVGPSGTAVIAGRAEPGSKVIVRDGDTVIGEVTADGRGEWVLVPEKPIAPGDRLLSLEASNPQGGAAVRSNETVALSIAPSTTGGKGETALAVVLPRDGAGAARVLQYPNVGGSASSEALPVDKPNALSMDSVEYDAQGRVVLSGRATPKATIQIYLGNEPFATVTADDSGAWTATSARPVGHRRLELRLDQLADDGRVVQRVAVPFARPAELELTPGREYVVQPGNNLWQIARRAYGAGTRYLIIYSANLPQIRDPGRIYPGQIFKLPKS
jgi:nucleoid-associated protein YgaU